MRSSVVSRRSSVGVPKLTPSLTTIYEYLDGTYGEEVWHWMPDYVRGPMDVSAGAVLVQHTNWRNAERALENLRDAGALDPARSSRWSRRRWRR